MDREKRKREDGGGKAERSGREAEDDVTAPADEEVEEFFATLKRIHVAVRYFRERNGGRGQDFGGDDFKRECGSSRGNRRVELDLNSDPVCDVSDLDS